LYYLNENHQSSFVNENYTIVVLFPIKYHEI